MLTSKAGFVSPLTIFGLFAVSCMLFCYAYENRHPVFILLFAFSCALGSLYGFLQGAWPFGIVEAVWAGVAVRRWQAARWGAGKPARETCPHCGR